MHGQFLLQAACLSSWFATVQAQALAITNVAIVNVTGGTIQGRHDIMVNNNTIARIEKAGTSPIEAEEIIDGTDKFVMPGLWDTHVHLYFTNDKKKFATTDNSVMPLLMSKGVLAVRDLGSNLEAVTDARERIAQKQLQGPRIFTTGPMLDGQFSPFETVVGLDDDADVGQVVERLKTQDVDQIKVHLNLSESAMAAVAKACQDQNIMFGGHVPDSITAQQAVDLGMNYIEHMSRIEAKDEKLIASIGEKKLWVTTTLVQGATPQRLRLAKMLKSKGAQLTAGTDAPAGQGLCPGSSLHQELRLMNRAGLTTLETLQAATIKAAQLMNMESQLGAIERGMLADMLVLTRNPLKDINNTQSIFAVVADGKLFTEEELDEMSRSANAAQTLPFACSGKKISGRAPFKCCSV